jgi:hypothetical protein
MLRAQPEPDDQTEPTAANGSDRAPSAPPLVSETTLRMRNDMRLDDATVARVTALYPDNVREDVVWLAAYCRQQCNGRLDLLVDHARKKGFKQVSKNYFYKVLSGRYFTVDKDGGIVGSVDNFSAIAGALRAGVLLAERAGRTPFIETGTWELIRDYIDVRRMPDAICKFGVIIGPTGGQKTECGRHYCHLNNHGKCVHLEAPAMCSMMEFLTDLTDCYGGSKQASSAVKMRDISNVVTEKHLILVDNVQRLYRKGSGGDQPVFNYLQKLQDKTGCAIIFMVAAIEQAWLIKDGVEKGYFEQFEGRAGGRDSFLVLDDYTPKADLRQIAHAYEMPDADEEPTLAYLDKLARKPGRCRILFDALQKAKRKSGGRPVTMELIKEVRGEESK